MELQMGDTAPRISDVQCFTDHKGDLQAIDFSLRFESDTVQVRVNPRCGVRNTQIIAVHKLLTDHPMRDIQRHQSIDVYSCW